MVATLVWIASLFLQSETFISRISKPKAFEIILQVEVLPIPGGPLIRQALAFTFGTFSQNFCPNLPPLVYGASFFFPRIYTSSQSFNHSYKLVTIPEFPIIS